MRKGGKETQSSNPSEHSSLPGIENFHDVITHAMAESRRKGQLTQAQILQKLNWGREAKSVLSRIEQGESFIRPKDALAIAGAYGLDPAVLACVQAVAEIEHAGRQPAAMEGLRQSVLQILGCRSLADLSRRILAQIHPTALETRQHLRTQALETSLLAPWHRAAEAEWLPPVRLATITEEYAELELDAVLKLTGPLALHGTRTEGVGLWLAGTLKDDWNSILIVDSRFVFGEQRPSVMEYVKSRVPQTAVAWLSATEQDSTSSERPGLWIVYDYFSDVVGNVSSMHIQQARRGLERVREVFVCDRTKEFEDIIVLLSHAKHFAIAPPRLFEALEFLRATMLTAASAIEEPDLAQIIPLLSRGHIWIAAAEMHTLEAPESLPTATELLARVGNLILEAEARREDQDPEILSRLRKVLSERDGSLPPSLEEYWLDVLGLPALASDRPPSSLKYSQPILPATEPSRLDATVLVENASGGKALASLIDASPDWAGRLNVVLAPFHMVTSYPESKLSCDILVTQHYSQFRTLCRLGKVFPLQARVRGTFRDMHSVAARSICFQDGLWWGWPVSAPTKLASFRPQYFPNGLPRRWADVMRALRTGASSRGSTNPKFLLQLRRDHPSLYYEWLTFVYAQGGADVLPTPFGGIQVSLDSQRTIDATKRFVELSNSPFCDERSRKCDWYSAFQWLGGDESIALAFPFTDGIDEVLESRLGQPQAPTTPLLRWAFPAISIDDLPRRTSNGHPPSMPLLPTTLHIAACLSAEAIKTASDFAMWMAKPDTRQAFLARSVDSILVGWDATPTPSVELARNALGTLDLARQYLAPLPSPTPLDLFAAANGFESTENKQDRLPITLNHGQQLVLSMLGRIVHDEELDIGAALRETANEIRSHMRGNNE